MERALTESRPPPYPADTTAKGWRFELDHERIEQSDTWALAPAEIRPWLLMLWMMSWRQTPCGTLPMSDAVIAARIGMPARTFAKHREVLMRGWWAATDGRLYHDTITVRVRAMLNKRASDAKRAADRRARKGDNPGDAPVMPGGSPPGQPPGITPASRVTPPEVPPEFDTKHQAVEKRLRTDTQPGVSVDNFPEQLPEPSPYGAAWAVLHGLGIVGASPGDAVFRAMVDKGVAPDEWRAAAELALRGGHSDAAYVVGVVKRRREEAAQVAAGLPAVAVPGVSSVTVPPAETAQQWAERMAAEREAARMTPEQKASNDAAAAAALARLGRRSKRAVADGVAS